MFESLRPIFPETASVTPENHLAIGGTDVAELVERFGSPLYVFDEATLRGQCRRFVEEFSARYPNVLVAYAA
ncbi:MAG: diaminopimelate decarboxylase, partial [Chloroflexi bacterium]|nr:diaminopimelate decarboxylase [Chloroflexota bacterium]